MSVHFDQDNGPGTRLTEEHCAAIEQGIREIDLELTRCSSADINDLHRQRRHLVAELAAGMRLDEPDEDGDYITLTEEDRKDIAAEIAAYDAELLSATELPLIRELGRRQRHLAEELQLGRRLPIADVDDRYDYEIVPRGPELGGGWRLYLIQNNEEVGGGVFPAESHATAAREWWDVLDKNQRMHWTIKGLEAGNAHLAYLKEEAWHDATQAAGEWLDSRPQK